MSIGNTTLAFGNKKDAHIIKLAVVSFCQGRQFNFLTSTGITINKTMSAQFDLFVVSRLSIHSSR